MSQSVKTTTLKKVIIGTTGLIGLAAVLAVTAPAMAGKDGHKRHMGGHMGGMHKAHLEMVDTNKDGKISKAEVEAAKAKHFAEADADGNGAISYDEFEAMAEKRRAMMRKHRFDRQDKDGNGTLSADELGGRHAGRFEKMDLDGDGEITKEERKAAHKKMRKMHHQRGE